MHDFGDLDEVERVLQSLAEREPEPLVTSMARGRWGQLLGGTPEASPEPDAPMPFAAAASSQALEERVAALEREITELKQKLAGLL
jgi:uncharacterized protein YceH (UPF0502 family)